MNHITSITAIMVDESNLLFIGNKAYLYKEYLTSINDCIQGNAPVQILWTVTSSQ